MAQAYGRPVDLSNAEILERLVALNHARAAEETQGHVRWLRPEFQVGSPAPKPDYAGSLPVRKTINKRRTAE